MRSKLALLVLILGVFAASCVDVETNDHNVALAPGTEVQSLGKVQGGVLSVDEWRQHPEVVARQSEIRGYFYVSAAENGRAILQAVSGPPGPDQENIGPKFWVWANEISTDGIPPEDRVTDKRDQHPSGTFRLHQDEPKPEPKVEPSSLSEGDGFDFPLFVAANDTGGGDTSSNARAYDP